MTGTPVISTPEASSESMLGPGQEGLLQEFIAEQEAQAQTEEQQRILGKFNSTEDLAKAYQELEKKLGQGTQQTPDPSGASPTQAYTADQAVQTYGQEAVEALAEQGVDLADLMWQADQGKDISNHYDTLAATFKVPRQVVENYVARAQTTTTNTDTNTDTPASLTDSDVSELKGMVGGDDGFQQLSQWAAANLSPQELTSYNQAVDGGNKEAARWALLAIQARASSTAAAPEPKLISGGQPPAVSKFESQQQVLDAMNKTNDRGQRLYDVDDAYRQKFAALLARSDVF